MSQGKKEGENSQAMELENEKKEVVEAKAAEVYVLDEDDDDFEEFEIEGLKFFFLFFPEIHNF